MYTKNIIYTETNHGPIDLKTQARDFIAGYTQRKYSFFLANTFNHKGLWNPEKGLYISYFRAEEQPHTAITTHIFGEKQIPFWHGLTIEIKINKDNCTTLSIYGSSQALDAGTTPGIPKDKETQFFKEMINLFAPIPNIRNIKLGVSTSYQEYTCESKNIHGISVKEFCSD